MVDVAPLAPGQFFLDKLPQGTTLAGLVKSSGWSEMDPIFKVYPSQFVVVTGLPGCGKSTFLFNIIKYMCGKYGHKAWMYVPENELFLAEKFSQLFSDKPRRTYELFANKHCLVQSANYEHYNDEPRDIEWILARAYEAYAEESINHVVIDPWNELEHAKPQDWNLTDYIGYCLRRIKLFGRQTGCSMFVIAHPTKAVVGRDITLMDIEGSAHWYNKCDAGLIVKRDQHDTTVISAKVREQPVAGRPGKCIFLVDQQTGIFREQPGGGVVF